MIIIIIIIQMPGVALDATYYIALEPAGQAKKAARGDEAVAGSRTTVRLMNSKAMNALLESEEVELFFAPQNPKATPAACH